MISPASFNYYQDVIAEMYGINLDFFNDPSKEEIVGELLDRADDIPTGFLLND